MSALYADLVLTPEQIQAIGYVAVESANLEILAERMICAICFFQEASRKELIERRELSGKLAILRTLINERLSQGGPRDKFNAMYDLHMTAVGHRNTLIHGRWIQSPAGSPDASVAFHPKNPLRVVKAKQAMVVANSLAVFQQELESFYTLHGHKLSTSQ